jgi:hypothetical protein
MNQPLEEAGVQRPHRVPFLVVDEVIIERVAPVVTVHDLAASFCTECGRSPAHSRTCGRERIRATLSSMRSPLRR